MAPVLAAAVAGSIVACAGAGARLAGRATVPVVGRSPAVALRAGRPELGSASLRPTPSTGDDAVLVAVLHLQASLASGSSLLLAFGSLAAASEVWSSEAHRIVVGVHEGASLQQGLDRWAAGTGDLAVQLLADGLGIASTTGGSQVAALDSVARVLRERSELRREVAALAAQARASAVVVVAAPVAFAAVVALVDARIRAFFLQGAAGPACIVLGVALDLVGAMWMRHLIGRAS